MAGHSGAKWGVGKGKPARPIGETAATILQPLFAKRAGMTVELIAAWPDIVGEPHREYTLPLKIQWPRGADEDGRFEQGALVVACDGARAVLFQHEADEIVRRINAFFGFDAIARIRIVQKPLPRQARPLDKPAPTLTPTETKRLERVLAGIGDDGLRKRLERLGRGVVERNRQR